MSNPGSPAPLINPRGSRLLHVLAGATLLTLPVLTFAAESNTQSVTGIPIEWLFLVIGSLGGIVYLDLKHEVRSLHREGRVRSKSIRRLQTTMRDVCNKLHVNYEESDDE